VLTPCGGDLVGEWTIKQACISLPADAFAAACPGTKVTLSPLTATGTLSIRSDNTTSSSGVISFTEHIQFPASCFTQAQCTTLVSAFTDPTISDAQCEYDAGTGCSCSLISNQPSMSSGTYQVEGTNVTFTSSAAGAQPSVSSFCVSGNTATLHQANANGSSSTLVLTK
jgi:hypothetical protein